MKRFTHVILVLLLLFFTGSLGLSSSAANDTPKGPPKPYQPAKIPRCPGEPMVDVSVLIPDAIIDMRYATENNFLKKKVYGANICLLRKRVAHRLKRVADKLRDQKMRIVLWDCYRPYPVQVKMWEIHPVPGEVANPKYGSNHNKGAAVDLTLARNDGSYLEMPTDFDSFTPAAWRNATKGIPKHQLKNRDTLKDAMKAAGFLGIKKEWWHYNTPERRIHPLCDLSLAEVKDSTRE